MFSRREVLLKRFEQVSDELTREEQKIYELSQKLSSCLDKLETATDTPEKAGGKNLRQLQHLQFRTAKIEEQNAVEIAEIAELSQKLSKMELLGQCIYTEEKNVRKRIAL